MKPAAAVALRIGATLALLGGVLWITDGAIDRLRGAAPVWLGLAALALTAQTVLMALRWRLTARRLGLVIGARRAIGEYYLAQVVNMTLPGGVMGDAARAVRSRDDGGLARAAHAVMIERLAGQAAVFSILAVGLVWAILMPGGIKWPGWTLAPIAALALGAVPALYVMGRLRILKRFSDALRMALLSRTIWPVQAALGLVIAGLNLAAFAFSARATGTSLPVEAVVTIVPLILFAMLVPLSVGGWGWREGAAAALFPLVGATAGAGVAASVAYGIVMLVASLPGALWPFLAPRRADVLTAGSVGATHR